MLFTPWRDEEEELLSIDPIMKAKQHEETIRVNSKPFYFDRNFDDLFLNEIMQDIEDNDNEENMGNETIGNEWELENDDEMFENARTHDTNEISPRVEQFLPPKLVPDVEYLRIMRTLNDKQRRFVLNCLHLAKLGRPFHIMLSGGAGVGKSHAVTALVQSAMRYFFLKPAINPDEVSVLVAAPTGKAAHNVQGMTLHCAFSLPPNQKGESFVNLSDSRINTLRAKLRNVKLFIIDEISMVSVRQLYQIDQRLKQVYCSTADFGGKSVIAVGHFRQLPPVAGSPVFSIPTHLARGQCAGNCLWDNFVLYELDEIMRQRGDFEFCKALNNMAEGCMDEEDIHLIKSREIGPENEPPTAAIHLFRTNDECQAYNSLIHKTLSTEGANSVAYDRTQGM